MSEHPRPLRKPPWDSGNSSSTRCCKQSCRIPAIALPTTSSREIPLQLSQLDKSLFLGIGTSTASVQSLETLFSLQAVWTMVSSLYTISGLWKATFTISGRVPELPPAFPSLRVPIASTNSSIDGNSAIHHTSLPCMPPAEPSQIPDGQLCVHFRAILCKVGFFVGIVVLGPQHCI